MAPFMNSTPDTRYSLLIRVRDTADQAAWEEFVEIYRPVIVRLARQKGMQEADSEDIAQRVLISIARKVEEHAHDPTRAKFRTWLQRVAHNAILNAITRRKPDQGAGDSAVAAVLLQQQSNEATDTGLIQLEYRREVFRWAARHVRDEFQPSTWDAFWLTAVEDRPIGEVAQQLGKNRGAIYAARSRVIRRIREKVNQFEKLEE